MSRRLYRRRADMMVFMTIAVVLIGVVAVYTQMQEQAGRSDPERAQRSVSERLVILAAGGTPAAFLDREALALEVPFFLAALEQANRSGSSELVDPMRIDMVWFHLEGRGIASRAPLTVGFEGETFRIRMSV